MNYDELRSWVDFLSVKRAQFNNLPTCPFAKQALLQDKILIVNNLNNIDIVECLKRYEVIVLFLNPDNITAEELYELSLEISNEEIVALDDHPFSKEQVGDVVLNNGKYALLLIQHRKKLEQARTTLKTLGYYNNWDPKYLAEVLGQ